MRKGKKKPMGVQEPELPSTTEGLKKELLHLRRQGKRKKTRPSVRAQHAPGRGEATPGRAGRTAHAGPFLRGEHAQRHGKIRFGQKKSPDERGCEAKGFL